MFGLRTQLLGSFLPRIFSLRSALESEGFYPQLEHHRTSSHEALGASRVWTALSFWVSRTQLVEVTIKPQSGAQGPDCCPTWASCCSAGAGEHGWYPWSCFCYWAPRVFLLLPPMNCGMVTAIARLALSAQRIIMRPDMPSCQLARTSFLLLELTLDPQISGIEDWADLK